MKDNHLINHGMFLDTYNYPKMIELQASIVSGKVCDQKEKVKEKTKTATRKKRYPIDKR